MICCVACRALITCMSNINKKTSHSCLRASSRLKVMQRRGLQTFLEFAWTTTTTLQIRGKVCYWKELYRVDGKGVVYYCYSCILPVCPLTHMAANQYSTSPPSSSPPSLSLLSLCVLSLTYSFWSFIMVYFLPTCLYFSFYFLSLHTYTQVVIQKGQGFLITTSPFAEENSSWYRDCSIDRGFKP